MLRRITRLTNKHKKPKKIRRGGKQLSSSLPVVEHVDNTEVNIIVDKVVTQEEDKAFVEKILYEKKKKKEEYIEYAGYHLYENNHLSIEEIELMEELDIPKEYYVIIDFEATCDKNNSMPNKEREIIEFAAVLVNKKTLLTEDEFDMFVKPINNPILTDYCVTLTSISQEDVDDAFKFNTVLSQFSKWLTKHKGTKTFCSWGAYDKRQLEQDCAMHGSKYPFDNDEHIDVKKLFSATKGYKRKYSLSNALKKIKIDFQGTQHRGIDDARNIAAVMRGILR